jgi:hypothetical protein
LVKPLNVQSTPMRYSRGSSRACGVMKYLSSQPIAGFALIGEAFSFFG